uniref:Ig-like domain-containing protein n=1 Tax=Astyanax mexicanus TaxID=7994 RepID=A0A8B9L891_ASTMX
MIRIIFTLTFFCQWTSGFAEDNGVTQTPLILWVEKGKPAEMNCSHNKDASYIQMYWYRQYPGKSMELIVYTSTSSIDFGTHKGTKFSAYKKVAAIGSFTVNEVNSTDNAVYFCAVSQHSVTDLLHHCTKTPELILL